MVKVCAVLFTSASVRRERGLPGEVSKRSQMMAFEPPPPPPPGSFLGLGFRV